MELNQGYGPLVQALNDIQCHLKVQKKNNNVNGDYKFRNCEDIVEAVKPMLEKHNLVLLLTDSVEAINENIYVKATAKLIDDKGYCLETSAYAREAQEKNKFLIAEPMLTGSSSSYARKYALNGLFALDDNKDLDDNMNYDSKSKNQNSGQKATPNQVNTIRKNLTELQIWSILSNNNVLTVEELSKDVASEVVNDIFRGVYQQHE